MSRLRLAELCALPALAIAAPAPDATAAAAVLPSGVLQASLVVAVLLLLNKIRAKPVDAPCPPGGNWFFGNTAQFLKNFETLPDFVLKYTLELGGTVGMRMVGFGPMKHGVLCISSQQNVKYVMKDNFENFEKGELFKAPLYDFLGDGIFTSDGATWRMHRKVAAAMFTRNLLQLGTTVALAQAEKLHAKVAEHIASGTAFNLQACYFNFTLDVFASIAFGVELDSQNHTHAFGKAFDFVQRVSNDRFGNPLWAASRALGLGQERECAKQIKVMKSFGRRIIATKRRAATDASSMGPDLISRFLTTAARNGETMSDNELLDIVLNFMIAGRDTTASALSWTTFELLRAPAEMAKVRAELTTVLPAPGSAEEATAFFGAVYNGLPYLKAVCSEALRLHPSVMKEAKFAIKDDVLPDGTKVRAGQGVFFSPYAMGRLPQHFEDPNEFKPARFVKKTAAEGTTGAAGAAGAGKDSLYGGGSMVSDYLQPVFNAGPRVCLGRPLAYLEIQLLIAFLLQRFEFKLDREHTDEYVSSLVSPMKHGLWVTAAART